MNDEFKGMTVNERLFKSGLIDQFDKAVEEKDIELIRSILKKIEITDESLITPILKQLDL